MEWVKEGRASLAKEIDRGPCRRLCHKQEAPDLQTQIADKWNRQYYRSLEGALISRSRSAEINIYRDNLAIKSDAPGLIELFGETAKRYWTAKSGLKSAP